MKIKELHPKLQITYPNKQGYGVEKGRPKELANIWFVIPPQPRIDAPAGVRTDLLRQAQEVLNQLPKLGNLAPIDQLVLNLLIRREAVQSSRIEGTNTTIEQILGSDTHLFNDDTVKSAQASVLAYAQALEKTFQIIQKKGIKAINASLIRNLHLEIMSKDPMFRSQAGHFRSEIGTGVYATIGGMNRIEESIYNPNPPHHIEHSLKQHISWLTSDENVEYSRAGLAPGLVVRLAREHSHFEAIHPFPDGNGRVGRMIIALQMVAENISPLYLSGYIEANKKAYSIALQESQKKLNEAPLIHFICKAIIESHEESQITKKILSDLELTWRKTVKARANSAQDKLLHLLIESPITSVNQIVKKLKLSQPAVKNAVDQLTKSKIIRERTGKSRNRVFVAEEVIEVLARPFGENPAFALNRARALLNRN